MGSVIPSTDAPSRICVDLTWASPSCMDIESYSETMVRSLAAAGPDLGITLIVPIGASRGIKLPNVTYHSLPLHGELEEGLRQIALPSYLDAVAADCLLAPGTLLPVIAVCPMISGVHDLNVEPHPESFGREARDHWRRWVGPSLAAADVLLATSDSVATDLSTRMHIPRERVMTLEVPVRESLKGHLSKSELKTVLSVLQVGGPYFLHVSNLCSHKNLDFLLQAFRTYLHANPGAPETLILVGSDPLPSAKSRVFESAKSLGIVSRLRFVANLADLYLKALYQGSRGFLFPSLMEGWAPPVCEARALGSPVVASPWVSSAAIADRCPLVIDTWVERMGSMPVSQVAPPQSPTLASAGARLLESISIARTHYRNRVGASAAPGAARGQNIGLPAKLRIAIRGDWYSPSGLGEAARSVSEALTVIGMEAAEIHVPKDTVQDTSLWTREVVLGAPDADLWVHCLPPEYADPGLPGKHAALFFWETDRLPTSDAGREWVKTLSRMTELWVPSEFVKGILERSGVTAPITKVPLPVDSNLFSPGPCPPLDLDLPPGFDSSWTVFLYVGTWDFRKQPDALVRSFTSAFTEKDRALLLIKSYVTGNPDRDRKTLTQRSTKVSRSSAHLRIIPEVLSRKGLAELYRFATAFVTASHGEGYCLPAVQAMSCGLPVIAAGWSSLAELAAIPVEYRLESIPQSVKLLGYSPEQQWAAIDESDLSKKLRWTHENCGRVRDLGAGSRRWVEEHAALRVVGERLKARINFLSEDPARGLILAGKGT